MTSVMTKTLARKITLALGALVVSTMTLASANQAHAGVKIYLGSGWNHGWVGPGFNYCNKYWWKYQKTGKFYFKKKYMKCMGYW